MKWIELKIATPITYQEGEWDGKRSDCIVVENSAGLRQTAHLYSGQLDGSDFSDYYDMDGYEIKDVKRWLALPE